MQLSGHKLGPSRAFLNLHFQVFGFLGFMLKIRDHPSLCTCKETDTVINKAPSMNCTVSVIGCMEGATTFACKSQECPWQDRYIYDYLSRYPSCLADWIEPNSTVFGSAFNYSGCALSKFKEILVCYSPAYGHSSLSHWITKTKRPQTLEENFWGRNVIFLRSCQSIASWSTAVGAQKLPATPILSFPIIKLSRGTPILWQAP